MSNTLIHRWRFQPNRTDSLQCLFVVILLQYNDNAWTRCSSIACARFFDIFGIVFHAELNAAAHALPLISQLALHRYTNSLERIGQLLCRVACVALPSSCCWLLPCRFVPFSLRQLFPITGCFHQPSFCQLFLSVFLLSCAALPRTPKIK